MKLTQRLSLTHGLIALLAVLVMLGVMVGGARYFFWNEIHESQNRLMQNFDLAVRESYFAHEDVATLDFIRLSVKDPVIAFAAFTERSGKAHLVLPPSFGGADMGGGNRILADGRRLSVLSSTVQAGGQTIGTIALAFDALKLEARVKAQVDRWLVLGLAAGVCALLIALGVSILLAKNLVRPLKRIGTGTDQVRAGKLDKLVDVDRSDEIGDLARAFNTMVVQLKELEAAKRDFVAGVTHDFGTPLHAIKSALEYLQERKAGSITSKQAEYLLMISNSTHQLTNFINNLLTTARIEAAKVEPYYETTDALALTREVVGLYKPQAEKKGLELTLLNEEASFSMITDVTMFRQILTNLVSNAMKYTVVGKVSVDLARRDGFVTLKVADTGVGIAPEHQIMIFDKFFRVRQPKSFPVAQGTGLGLAITKGLAEAMGGSVMVKSEPGKGSTFSVKLPRRSSALKENKEVEYASLAHH